MTDNVTSLGAARAIASGDNRLWTPIECLEDAIRDIKSGTMKADGVVVMFVDRGTDHTMFNVGHYSANIKASEIISAAEILKVKLFNDMGYI